MQINFLNEYYKAKSIDQNNTDLVNMYLEVEQTKLAEKTNDSGVVFRHGKYKVIGINSPGKTLFNNDSGSVTRGSVEHRGIYYAVVDNTLYSYSSNGTRASRGTLNSSTGQVEFSLISNQITIVDSINIYNYNIDTSTFTVVSDLDAPTTPKTTAAQDEIVLITPENSVTVYGSDISNGLSWNALSFGSKTTTSDYIQRLMAFNSRIWVIGTYNSEIWYNSGAATFSFEIVQGSSIKYGTPAKNSVAAGTQALYMLAQSKLGGLCVLSMNESGIVPTPNQGVIEQINRLTTIVDAIGYCYEKSGHEFYMLTFPTEGISFEYDITSDVWSSRTSYINSVYTRDLGNCYSYCYGKHLVGSFNSGTIYSIDSTVYSENNTPMLKRIVTPPAYAEGKKVKVSKLQIDTEKSIGSNKTITLDVSFDSGHTFSDSYSEIIPDAGGRMYWTRLGQTQDAFVFKLSTTMDAKFIVLGAFADVEVGIN